MLLFLLERPSKSGRREQVMKTESSGGRCRRRSLQKQPAMKRVIRASAVLSLSFHEIVGCVFVFGLMVEPELATIEHGPQQVLCVLFPGRLWPIQKLLGTLQFAFCWCSAKQLSECPMNGGVIVLGSQFLRQLGLPNRNDFLNRWVV